MMLIWKPSLPPLERFATNSDRMVGVIIDVLALAERVPVRFVVSHTGVQEEMPRS
jgi:hypothetical protein